MVSTRQYSSPGAPAAGNRGAMLLHGAVVFSFLLNTTCRAAVEQSTYLERPGYKIGNDLVEAEVTPQLGGRVIQFRLGGHEFLWVNEDLAGKGPTPTGLAPDKGWVNYGGSKLWPAPQGWGRDDQWPGPPDAVLDGSTYTVAKQTSDSLSMHSRDDERSGIRFSNRISARDGFSGIRMELGMKNIDTKPRRWGIWQVTQLNAAEPDGYNKQLFAYCPANPRSRYDKGYYDMFGLVNNPSFRLDRATSVVVSHYERVVGKIGIDSDAGWLAVVDGKSGHAFIKRFRYFADKQYPDNASVEFWMNAPGQIVADNKIASLDDDLKATPPFLEAEVLSPFAQLQPGESYTFHVDWYATNIGGNYPVVDCTEVGVRCEPVKVRPGNETTLSGRFGVFRKGKLEVAFQSQVGREVGKHPLDISVSPLQPVVLEAGNAKFKTPGNAATFSLRIIDENGAAQGDLARDLPVR